jgi:hypothetical protein
VATTPDFALDHYEARAALVQAATQVAVEAWRQVDTAAIAETWAATLAELTTVVAGAQLAAAQMAEPYLAEAVAFSGASAVAEGVVNAAALAGIASDGRELLTLLFQPAVAALLALQAGADIDEAMATGHATLDMITRTQVADAGRVADSVGLTAHPDLDGYVRVVVGRTCSRCIVLAGRVYQWNEGFDRHPRCDCIHLPARQVRAAGIVQDPRRVFDSMSREEQDKVFTIAGAQAIRDGADVARVVNARRTAHGLTPAGGGHRTEAERAAARLGRERGRLTRQRVFGRQHFTTLEGITLPDIRRRRVRLMPESIYELADGDRDEAIRLLKAHGYILGPGPRVTRPKLADISRSRPWFPPGNLTPAAASAMQRRMLRGSEWTASQREAITEYTGGWAADINNMLRGTGPRSDIAERFTGSLWTAMRPMAEPALLYRFTGLDAFGPGVDAAKLKSLVGKTLQDRGFMSTTLARSGWDNPQMQLAARRQVVMEIDAPAKTRAAYVEDLSVHRGQWEVVLAAGTRYRVIEVVEQGRQTVVRVRVIP